jgi:uncharacterized protein YqhQ
VSGEGSVVGGEGPVVGGDVARKPLRLGGMALRNGLLVHGPSHWAAAVRGADGEIAVASGRKPRVRAFDAVPGARGVVRMAESIAVVGLVKRSLPQARMPFSDRRVLAVAAVSGVGANVLRRRASGSVAGELAASLLSFAPAAMALRGGELAAYHGVEHKAIGAYEQGSDDPLDATKEHDRCGSHLIAPMLSLDLAATALASRLRVGDREWVSGAAALVSLGAAMELLAWSERHRQSVAARLLRVPGHELQRVLGTREPDERQLEVGRAAMAEILHAEGAPA